MTDKFESKIKRALKDIDKQKTSACLDTTAIGLFCEGKLPQVEMARSEEHIRSCLYCLYQLNEMQELLYYHKQGQPQGVAPAKIKLSGGAWHAMPLLKEFFIFPFRQWRYAAVSLASISAAIFITLTILKPEKQAAIYPTIDPNSFVNIRAIAENGKPLNEVQGVVVNANGLVASNLSPLVKASAVQITLRDGTQYQTKNIWMDENRNIAVMKIDNAGTGFKPASTEDIRNVSIGQSVFLVDDSRQTGNGFKQALVSDFRSFPGRLKDREIQYIQLASFSAQMSRSAIVDKDGRFIGLVITAEKNINLAVPLNDVEKFIKGRKPVPISELKQVRFSADALNFYMKGILARDAQKWDEAMEYFKRAIELNLNLEGAHLELGYIYYRKQLYDLEAREYEEALRINPQNTDAIFSLATNFETRGLYKNAIKEFERVIVLDPSYADALYELGLAYLAEGQKSKAKEIYPKLKKLDPGMAEMLKRLAISH